MNEMMSVVELKQKKEKKRKKQKQVGEQAGFIALGELIWQRQARPHSLATPDFTQAAADKRREAGDAAEANTEAAPDQAVRQSYALLAVLYWVAGRAGGWSG